MSEPAQYNIEARKIFYPKTGKHVATINDENVIVFEPGCSGSHTRMLSEYLKANGLQYANLPEPPPNKLQTSDSGTPPEQNTIQPVQPDGTGPDDSGAGDNQEGAGETPLPAPAPPPPPQKAEWAIDDIPDDRLPPFDKMLGTATPGFAEYVKQHKLNKTQLAALIARLERKK